MTYYHIAEKLEPIQPEEVNVWEKIAVILKPEEIEAKTLPPMLLPPDSMLCTEKIRSCRLIVEQNRILGEILIPQRPHQPEKRVVFVWWNSDLLFLDPDGEACECVERVKKMRPHHADGADDLLMDFYLALIMDDLAHIQNMEERISGLEKMVLDNRTDMFIRQMSQLRKELNQHNRYYAQMNDMVVSLQENTTDLLDECSLSRLQYILRRLNRLQSETQMLREYASQVSSEYQAQVDLGQNRIMKLLTIVTTIFMPLSLIAGWYGMNFVNMPELHWTYGYPVVIALSVLIVAGCIYYFKKKRYW